jgi:DNA polymerase-3 subunit delta
MARELADRLAKAKPPAWLLIHGDEMLLKIEAADAVRAWGRQVGFDEREVLLVDRYFKVESLDRACRSTGLFCQGKLVELRFPAKPHKGCIEWLTAWAHNPLSGVMVMASCAKLDRLHTDTAWFRALDRAGWAIDASTVRLEQLPAWVRQRLTAEGLEATDELVGLIVERTEGNLLAAAQEIRKLEMIGTRRVDYALAQASLSVSARFSAFDLQSTCQEGDRARALRILAGLLAEGEPMPLIVWALAEGARQVLRAQALCTGGMPRSQALRQLRVHPQRFSAMGRALDRLDAGQCLQLLEAAGLADRCIKGVGPLDAGAALRDLVLRWTAKSRPQLAPADLLAG